MKEIGGYKRPGDVVTDPTLAELGLQTQAIYRWCNIGLLAPDGARVKLRHQKIGRQRRVRIDDVVEFLEKVKGE